MSDNLKPFTSENQPVNRKSRKGVPNRSTLIKKWLKLKVAFPNRNEETGQKIFEELDENVKITLQDSIVLALIQKAQSGDVLAIKEVQDTIYGKITEKQDLTTGGEKLTPTTIIIQGVEGTIIPNDATNSDNSGSE